ncbi:MAG: class I SAM-dependent methyltransferase [Nanoarchaeota archaeon]|nr:class I SAM-dependent methyltransferase [Nanoarchaeota archaeon]
MKDYDKRDFKDLTKLKRIFEPKYDLVNYCRNKKVLEVGCINHSLEELNKQIKLGNWLFGYLNVHCSKAVGIDIADEAVQYLKANDFDVRLADAQSFDLGEKFDIVIAPAILDHLMNYEGFFKSCSRHLKPGGELLILEDNILSIPFNLFSRIVKGPELGHHDDITFKLLPISIQNFARSYGFSVKNVKYFAGAKIIRILDKLIPYKFNMDSFFYDHYICFLKKGRDLNLKG